MTRTPHPASEDVARLRRLAENMDSAFRLPGTQIRFGWDSIIGLVPGVGDTLALLPSAYIMRESYKMGAPKPLLARMVLNAGIDYVIGTIPLVGDIFDVGWKSKLRNVALLERHLEERAAAARPVQDVEGHLSSHHPNLGG